MCCVLVCERQNLALGTTCAPGSEAVLSLSPISFWSQAFPVRLESEEAQKEGKNLAVMKTCCAAYGRGREWRVGEGQLRGHVTRGPGSEVCSPGRWEQVTANL